MSSFVTYKQKRDLVVPYRKRDDVLIKICFMILVKSRIKKDQKDKLASAAIQLFSAINVPSCTEAPKFKINSVQSEQYMKTSNSSYRNASNKFFIQKEREPGENISIREQS